MGKMSSRWSSVQSANLLHSAHMRKPWPKSAPHQDKVTDHINGYCYCLQWHLHVGPTADSHRVGKAQLHWDRKICSVICAEGPFNKSYYNERKKQQNLEVCMEWFNRLSYLLATEICMPIRKQHTARMIEYFIDVTWECFNIGNFNSLMVLISDMNMSPVSWLKKTWAKAKTVNFDMLENQMRTLRAISVIIKQLSMGRHKDL